MLNLKIGEKEYNIKFSYLPTVKSDIVSRMTGNDKDAFATPETFMLFVPEVLLVGLQKNHKDEFGYDYDTNEGKEEALEKVYDMMDDYFDNNDSNIMQLYTDLQNEMSKDGFLKDTSADLVAQNVEKENVKNTKKATPKN